MSHLPNPLTPTDCDLTGYRWMPLDVVRVIDSDTFGLSTGDEFKTAFRLWAKSWQQVPAASLPSDDRLLAHLAGLSENMPKWKKQRTVALRGWILCSDGRLYHPVIAEKALEAMQRRGEHVEKEENEQSRQQRYRERRKALFELLREHGIVPPAETKMPELERLAVSLEASPSVTGSVTSETHGDVTHDVTATAIEKDRTVQDSKPKTEVLTDGRSAPPATARPADLSAAMRRHSIEAQPGDPRIVAAAEQGISVETIEAACAEAKSSDPNGRIKAGFVIAIAQRWTADASNSRPVARAQPRSYHDERADTIAGLTGRNRTHEPDYDAERTIDVHAQRIA